MARRRPWPSTESLADLIGGTPLVRRILPGLATDGAARAKLETSNPLSSIKDAPSLVARPDTREGVLNDGDARA